MLGTGRMEAARVRMLRLLDYCIHGLNDVTLSLDLQAALDALDGYQRVDALIESGRGVDADVSLVVVARALYGDAKEGT
jgi:hypothetical protein